LLSLLERNTTSDTLVGISDITHFTSDSVKEGYKKNSLGYSALQWVFDIPDTLDTKQLTIKSQGSSKTFPWSRFKTTFKWQVIISLVIAIDIVLNPLLHEDMTMQELFGLTALVSMLIPLLVLPWGIYQRLDAKIKGSVKDFSLYNGIKTRTTQTVVAFGTLIIFIRLALQRMDLIELIMGFVQLFLTFMVVAFISSFVYLNYFEDDLAMDISNEFNEKMNAVGDNSLEQ
jgi:hypothetical protein